MWASYQGHSAVVQELLSYPRVEVNLQDMVRFPARVWQWEFCVLNDVVFCAEFSVHLVSRHE